MIRLDASDKPLFVQIAEGVEDAILDGSFAEEEAVPSITEFAKHYNINPATALKGVNLLVDLGVLYKKRGIGMFVAKGARETLKEKRKAAFASEYLEPLLSEAKRLGFEKKELQLWIERGFQDHERD